MEEIHKATHSPSDLDIRETPRKVWHAPKVEWLDPRDAQFDVTGGTVDGGGSRGPFPS